MGKIKPELKEAVIKLMMTMRQFEMKRPLGKDKIALDVFQYWLLKQIATTQPSIKDVEKTLSLSRNIVVSNISYLEKSALIVKEKNSGREARLVITEEGAALIVEADEQFDALLDFTEAAYSIKEERLLIDFMSDFCSSIDRVLDL